MVIYKIKKIKNNFEKKIKNKKINFKKYFSNSPGKKVLSFFGKTNNGKGGTEKIFIDLLI